MKSNCTLKNPPMRINGELKKSSALPVDRSDVARWLRSARAAKADCVRVYSGRYLIVPIGCTHGFVITTR